MSQSSSPPSSYNSSLSPVFAAMRFLVGAAALGVGAVAAVNAVIEARTPQLGPRLNGLFGRYPARFGDLAYVVAGDGPPLVLVHSLDPGQSSASWRAVFDALADHFTVYALDWQGYGLSDPNPEGLNAREFGAQLRDFLRDIAGEGAVVVAHGGGAPLALEATKGGNIAGLVLVCPDASAPDEPRQTERAEFLAHRELNSRLLGLPIYGRALLNWWRSQSHFEREAREFALWDKSRVESEARLWHTTAHQPGAHRAQIALLKGQFALPWRELWHDSAVPALLIWGRHARGFDKASEWGALRPDVSLRVVENALQIPQLDAPEEFVRLVLDWTPTRAS